ELIKDLVLRTTKSKGKILDFFGGSGTTGHAVLLANSQDKGERTFILCEQMDYARSLTMERIVRSVKKEGWTKISIAYCELLRDPIKDKLKATKNVDELLKMVSKSFNLGYYQYINSKEEL